MTYSIKIMSLLATGFIAAGLGMAPMLHAEPTIADKAQIQSGGAAPGTAAAKENAPAVQKPAPDTLNEDPASSYDGCPHDRPSKEQNVIS